VNVTVTLAALPEWVKPAPAEVSLVWAEAEGLFAQADLPYFAGVCAGLRWALGDEGALSAFDETAIRPSLTSVLVEDMRAVAISSGNPARADRGISGEYAAGVASSLGWLRGALDRPPIKRAPSSAA
jgi:hypothetical protein